MAAPGRLLGVRKIINSLCKLSVNPSATCRPSSTYSWRSHDCGALGAGDVGEGVRLAGWLQYRRLGFLLTLRDGTGVTQVTLPHKQLQEYVEALPTESVIEVKGTVQLRPEGQENKNMSTGEIEVIASDIKLLNACDSELPYQIRNAHKVKESLRLQYRYLDLRRPAMQRNLRLRSQILNDMRYFLCHKHGFVDVETPTLFRKTPGGAREFPVATHSPGQFYTLPQSPQQFKQLLMVGAIDRYMQVARCYRDETAKPNRQPEFTQLDLELSFTSQADVQLLVEELLRASWPVGEGEEEEGGQGVARLPEGPFPRLTYRQAMLRYGTDKPDTRFAMEIEDITEIVSHLPDKQLSVLLASGEDVKAKALTFHGAGNLYKKSSLKKVVQKLKEEYTLKNVYHGHILKTDEYQAWNIGEDTARSLQQRMEAGDVMIVAIGTETSALTLLGHVRLAMAAELERKGMQVRKENAMEFLWVEDFPMFLPKEDGTEGLESAHHPFTAPHPDDADLVYSHPEQARSQHYDLVLNGAEVGGGSIRIHDSKLQRHVLNNILKEDTSSLEHLLTALDYGCPPHGGIALGIDRLMSIICDTASIRDVIAFPKSGHGLDLMSKAPAPLTQQDLDYYHLPSQTDGENDPTQEKL